MTFDTNIDPILRAPAATQRGHSDCSDVASHRLIRPPHVHRRDYDAEGRRVRRTVGSTTTYYVYGADGGEGQHTQTLFSRRSQAPNPSPPGHLGSTRLIPNAQGACAQRLHYAPYTIFKPPDACRFCPVIQPASSVHSHAAISVTYMLL